MEDTLAGVAIRAPHNSPARAPGSLARRQAFRSQNNEPQTNSEEEDICAC